jgi:hypothetical protein
MASRVGGKIPPESRAAAFSEYAAKPANLQEFFSLSFRPDEVHKANSLRTS